MLSALSILCVQARRKTGLTDLKKHFNGCKKLLQHHCNSFSPIVESNFNKINISQITCKAIFNSCLQKLFFLISYTKKRETLKKRVSLLKVKATSKNSTFRNDRRTFFETFACFAFFLEIFLFLFQSHSPLCSIKRK